MLDEPPVPSSGERARFGCGPWTATGLPGPACTEQRVLSGTSISTEHTIISKHGFMQVNERNYDPANARLSSWKNKRRVGGMLPTARTIYRQVQHAQCSAAPCNSSSGGRTFVGSIIAWTVTRGQGFATHEAQSQTR